MFPCRTLFVTQLKSLFVGRRSAASLRRTGAVGALPGDSMASTPVVNMRNALATDDGHVGRTGGRHAQARANLMLLVPEVSYAIGTVNSVYFSADIRGLTLRLCVQWGSATVLAM